MRYAKALQQLILRYGGRRSLEVSSSPILLQQAPVIVPVVSRHHGEQTIFLKALSRSLSERNGERNTNTDVLSCVEKLK